MIPRKDFSTWAAALPILLYADFPLPVFSLELTFEWVWIPISQQTVLMSFRPKSHVLFGPVGLETYAPSVAYLPLVCGLGC